MKQPTRSSLLLAFVAAGVVVCAGGASATPAPVYPTLQTFFSGKLTGTGSEKDFEHSAPRSVAFEGTGTRIRGGLRLNYHVVFSDGERQHKVWTFLQSGPDTYVGHRSDLVGDAKITQTRNDLHLTYTAVVPTKGGSHNVNFDEHFTQIGPGTVVNRLAAKYLFLDVASGQITLHRVGK